MRKGLSMTAKRKRKETTRGRRAGGHNRGYWFRKGRGWYATENGKPVPLCAENGDHLKAQGTSPDLLERAYARCLTSSNSRLLLPVAQIEQIHRVHDQQRQLALADFALDLQQAAGVAGQDDLGAGA